MNNKQCIKEIIAKKIDQLINTAPEYGSISLEAIFHCGNLTRVILKSEESEIITSENK